MSLKNREIDNNGYVIIEPLIKVNVDQKNGYQKIKQNISQRILRKILKCKSSV